ncbi:hypothetical protein [Chondrinema litorale]|uniref:hypothetical protein n=1 Tax=Chondrinema litorale TaxID=2994555 RepID=UPI002543F586|nr:hypothetical protein [Chondrinema litorale]UZR94297.1 hypothetical protein OQ292_00510 [Chondrinema litorale]
MKKLNFLVFFLICSSFVVYGQDQIDLSNYNESQKEIIEQLQQNIKKIGNKTTEYKDANALIEETNKLCSENIIVEVDSERMQKIQKYRMLTYLEKLKLLKYENTEVIGVSFDNKDMLTSVKLYQH